MMIFIAGALIEFGRMFLTYGLLLLIVCAVAAVAIFLGITFARIKSNQKGRVEGGEISGPEA